MEGFDNILRRQVDSDKPKLHNVSFCAIGKEGECPPPPFFFFTSILLAYLPALPFTVLANSMAIPLEVTLPR